MGGSASLLQIPHDILNEPDTVKYVDVNKSSLERLKLSSEALANIRRKSNSEIPRLTPSSRKKTEKKSVHEVPIHIKNLLGKIGIKPTPNRTKGYNANTKKLVSHIFECLEGLQHMVQADQDLLATDESVDFVSETQSMAETNKECVGKLLHEMVAIYTLCGDTVRVLLHASPEAAKVEDNFGRLPLHVAVDHDHPWLDAIDRLIEVYPSALNRRDSVGRLPLHIAVDRQQPNIDAVNLLLRRNPHAAMARRGVGRLPLHYAIFADVPNLEVIKSLLEASIGSAQITDVYGRLPLHYAVDKLVPDRAVVACLLEAYPEGAGVRDSHMKLPLTVALERDRTDLAILRLLHIAYPVGLSERGGSGNKLPLQLLVESHPGNLDAIRYVAQRCTAAITVTSGPIKRDSPVLLSIDRNLPEVSRLLLILQPEFDPQRLRNLHWKARKIAFLLARRQIFRPSVLQCLAQLAQASPGKGSGGGTTVAALAAAAEVLATAAEGSLRLTGLGSPSTLRRSSTASVSPVSPSVRNSLAQNSARLREINAHLQPRRRHFSSGTIDPRSAHYEFRPVHTTAAGCPLRCYSGEDYELGVIDTSFCTAVDNTVDTTSYSPTGSEVYNIYHDNPPTSGRHSSCSSPRPVPPATPVNFYLRLYKTNSDAFRLAVTYL